MAFIHCFTGADGESYFNRDFELPMGVEAESHLGPYSEAVLKTPKYALPDKVRGVFFGHQTESVGGQHLTPQRHYSITLYGAGELETGSGDKVQLRAGDVLLDDNRTGTGHYARVAEAPWGWMAIILEGEA